METPDSSRGSEFPQIEQIAESVNDNVELKPKLRIVYRKVKDLSPYDRNPRTHSRSQLRKIQLSIQEFGFVNPLLLRSDLTIIAGHGRLEAAKMAGVEEVPTVILEGLSIEEARAYLIADNKLAMEAGWDLDLLKLELEAIILENEVDILSTGFETPEIDLILSPVDSSDPDDELPDELGFGVAQAGDLWKLGVHRIICGNSLNEETLAALMTEEKASVVFIDPPYNVKIDGHASGNGHTHHDDFQMACGEMTSVEFADFLSKAFEQLVAFSKSGSVHFVAMDWRHIDEIRVAGKRHYDALLNVAVWAKDHAGMGSFYRSQHELFFVFKAGEAKHQNNIQLGRFGRDRSNVWHYPSASSTARRKSEESMLAWHPTPKPVALVADALLDCSDRDDIVLDSFLGSGSTLMAAERVGRRCYGIELEPKYVDLAIRRWQAYTGQRAVHASTSKTFDEEATIRNV